MSQKNDVDHVMQWYQTPVEQVFETLSSNREGLTSEEPRARLSRYGYNELKFRCLKDGC